MVVVRLRAEKHREICEMRCREHTLLQCHSLYQQMLCETISLKRIDIRQSCLYFWMNPCSSFDRLASFPLRTAG